MTDAARNNRPDGIMDDGAMMSKVINYVINNSKKKSDQRTEEDQ